MSLKKGKDMKLLKQFLLFSAILVLLSGCLKFEAPTENYENQNISILYYDETNFFNLYGDFLRAEYPNINITVIPSKGKYGDELIQLINNKQPDIMILDNISLFQQLILNNHLSALSFENNDNFKFNEINPSIIDALKEVGNGTLYGLAPTYVNRALFYNKKLFDDYNLPYPTDHMTWQEVLETAAMFGGDNQVFGLDPSINELDFIINNIGKTENLALVDPIDLIVNIQSESWQKVWEMATSAYKSGFIYTPTLQQNNQIITLEQLNNQDVFLSEKAAMTYKNTGFMAQLNNTDIDWGVVTEPVSELNGDISSSILFHQIITINNYSKNKDFALAVFKYLNGPELSHIWSRQFTHTPARPLLNWNGYDISAIYKLQPDINNMIYDNINYEFWELFYLKCNELYDQLMQDEIDVEFMLTELQMWTELTIDTFVNEDNMFVN